MDTFFEQIIAIRKTGKTIAAVIGIWLAAFVLCFVLYLFPVLSTLTLLLIVGILYGAYKLSSMLNIEYEYIITNGTMDVDKIINKSAKSSLKKNLRKLKRNQKLMQNEL